MSSAFIVLAIIVGALAFLTRKRYRANVSTHPQRQHLNPYPLLSSSIIIGIGMGGFIDGILLHQILQWHELLSNKIPPDNYVNKSINMFWDGIFHLFTWITTLIGIILMWRHSSRRDVDHSARLLSGGLLGGWGIFNMVEGIIDHQLLKLHNVNEFSPNKEVWNIGFLALSVILLVFSWVMVRTMIHLKNS